MKHTQTYRNQHDEIRRAGQQLAAVMAGGDAIAIRKALAHLCGLVEAHLALEDSAFYPALYKHADLEVRRIAKAYQQSMGKLAGVYTEFRMRWMRAGAIEGDPGGFAKELADLAGALDKRIDLENTTLYSMVDGLEHVAV